MSHHAAGAYVTRNRQPARVIAHVASSERGTLGFCVHPFDVSVLVRRVPSGKLQPLRAPASHTVAQACASRLPHQNDTVFHQAAGQL